MSIESRQIVPTNTPKNPEEIVQHCLVMWENFSFHCGIMNGWSSFAEYMMAIGCPLAVQWRIRVGSIETESSKFLRLLELDFTYFVVVSNTTVSLSTKVHNGAP